MQICINSTHAVSTDTKQDPIASQPFLHSRSLRVGHCVICRCIVLLVDALCYLSIIKLGRYRRMRCSSCLIQHTHRQTEVDGRLPPRQPQHVCYLSMHCSRYLRVEHSSIGNVHNFNRTSATWYIECANAQQYGIIKL